MHKNTPVVYCIPQSCFAVIFISGIIISYNLSYSLSMFSFHISSEYELKAILIFQ